MYARYALRASPRFAFLLFLIHSLALCALMTLPWPLWLRLLAMSGLLCSLVYLSWRAAWLRMPASCVAVGLEGDEIELIARNGAVVSGIVQRDTLVTPHVIVLNILPQGARCRRSVVIFGDAMEQEDFRALRVRLRWQS